MNKEEILDLKAGNELDAIVTKTMDEWTVYEDDSLLHGQFKYRDHNESTLHREYEWNPSSNIADAFRVIDSKRDYSWIVQREGDYLNDENVWEVHCTGRGFIVKTVELPEAICKAYLLAVMDS